MSGAQGVTLSNTGTAVLTVSAIGLSGTNAGDFGLVHNCPLSPATMAVSASCTLNATFSPSAVGGRSGAITVTSNATTSPDSVGLTGTGVGVPAIGVTGSPVFAPRKVGTTSPVQTLTVSNTGSASLTLSSLTPGGSNPGDFARGGTCTASTVLAPAANCSVQVSFTPAAIGARSASLTIGSNDPATPNKVVTLSGTGLSRAHEDFDGDGKADVFWLNAGTTQTYVWEMNGATIASSGSPSSTGDPHWQVKGIGDFNGDGKADILYRHETVNINNVPSTGTGATAIWLMNGLTISGSGSPGTVADLGWQVQGVGDFDGDGKADILWMHTDGRVQVWLMNGTSSTSTPTVTNLGAGSGWSVQGIGDFNGDGKADVLWMNTNGTVVIWLMNGATIASSATLANVGAMTATSWLVQGVGDFDGDGKADILWRNDDLGGIIYTWMMNGTTILSASAVTGVGTVTGGGWVVKSIGDYNGDGKADVFWKNDTALGGITYVWLMNGTGISSANAVTGVSDFSWQVQNPK